MRLVRPAGVLLGLGVLAGCTVAPPTHFYTLSSAEPPAATATPTRTGPVIGLGPVDLPAYLDRPDIVTRVGSHEVRLGEFSKWAEPLQPMVVKLLADRLRQATGSRDVIAVPARGEPDPPHAVGVEIQRFDADATGKVVLDARWRVYQTENGRTLQSGHEVIEETAATPSAQETTGLLQGPDYGAVVAAMAKAVDDLAQKIAPAITRSVGSKGRPARG